MRRNVRSWMLLLGAVALPGCGSVQEVIVDAVQTSAKEAIDQAVDEAVDGLVDELLDFDGLSFGDEQPDE